MYRCKITDSSGNVVYSQAAKIVATNLAVTSQPQNAMGLLGDTVRMSITAHGEGLTYRWQVSGNGGST